jgi:uncharacterized membrane protein HdeD (DUF308 family)
MELARALTSREMALVYKFAKISMMVGGIILLGYGVWWLSEPIINRTGDPLYLFGIFPVYLGSMIILIALAMKEDWFTNARRYW